MYNNIYLYYSVPAILRATNRYRRDQRQLEEEEEIWFNDEDDFTDVTSVKPEYDTTIGELLLT